MSLSVSNVMEQGAKYKMDAQKIKRKESTHNTRGIHHT